VIDSCGMCNFMFFLALDEDQVRTLMESATGIDMGGYKGLMRAGERIFNLERLFNLRAGLSFKDDTISLRELEEISMEIKEKLRDIGFTKIHIETVSIKEK